MKQNKPILTIGIIFRDDIRSIERCLKALQPLRDAIPCELVMADTGSIDGSREIAEQYADILFDFPWINDFSAARNAVMDRASGKWFFTVDTDEYLDEDVTELTRFLRRSGDMETAAVVQRSYASYEMDDVYSDFMAQRLIKMSTNSRYQGMIHEVLMTPSGNFPKGIFLPHIILHHDGYVGMNSEQGKEKRKRNLTLLRQKLESEPDNMMIWLQLIESGYGEENIWDTLNQAAELVEQKKIAWDRAGPPIFRYAATRAETEGRPDAEEWIEKAQRLFPDSFFTQLDVQCAALTLYINRENYASCIEAGERYLKAMEDYRAGKAAGALCTSAFQCATKPVEQMAKTALAIAYENQGKPERALELLETIDYSKHFDALQTLRAVTTLLNIHTKSNLDTAPVLTALWEGIINPEQPNEKANARRQNFLNAAASTFTEQNRNGELGGSNFCRNGYTLFYPLEDKCEPGRAAVIMDTYDSSVLEEKLSKVEKWAEFPTPALAHAFKQGVTFPLPEKPLSLEEMDELVSRMSENKADVIRLACKAGAAVFDGNWQLLTWTRGLVLSAVQVFGWDSEDADAETGLALARAFAQTEKEFLLFCYAPQVLCRKNLFALPPMHRFGWYCAQAFDALDAGDAADYVRLLREGLTVCEGVKDMAQFLLDHTPELHEPEPSAELQALADQIRTILAAYPADDPAVAALKASEAYQKVAVLIEGAEVPIVGGLMQ